ncbi:hypothetical protein Taro_033830 [Colocasia esculenta]|uniref:Leucine-rich repeat-containing N-terminal plant-type domain-containing protein n=1 Tax=Colocasia esculenta TaxID=4460 RepID=A0A843W5U7_COLES|nr:hypothetical protein [Colocasia esculenta]
MSPSFVLRRLMQLLPPLLLISALPTALSAATCNPDDKHALLQLKKALGDPHTLVTWTADTNCCMQWFAMDCDPNNGRVTSLHIYEFDAAGSLPSSIGDLPYLDTLTFRMSPNLTGPLPPELSKLAKLQTLWMDWNSLTGPVPAFLGWMARLNYINLSFNKLSGFIPPSLGHLPQLMALYLDNNRLKGTIPASLGRLRRPTGIYIGLRHNHLTGPVPPSFRNLNIIRIDLSWNQISGDPSVLFKTGGWSAMSLSIDLSRNHLEFDLSKANFSSNLWRLDLSHNRVYGNIPAPLATIEELESLNLSYNRLCGEIP